MMGYPIWGYGTPVGGYYGGGYGTSTAVILVLFILIAIIARAGRTDVVGV
jgi:hypothetical protein